MKKMLLVLTCMAAFLFAGVAQAGIFGGGSEEGEGQSLFEKSDQDSDGVITQQEFQDFSLEDKDKTRLFEMLDEQGQGQITKDQWRSMKESQTGMSAPGEQPMGAEDPMAAPSEEQPYGATEQPYGATEQPMGTEDQSAPEGSGTPQ